MTTSSTEPHDADPPGPEGAATDHAAEGHPADDHGRDAEALGPVDVFAWGAGALGVLLGLGVAFCFALATSAVAG